MTSVKTRGTNYHIAMQHMAHLESWARQNGNQEQADMIKTCATVFRQSHRPPLSGIWVYAQRVAQTHVAMEALLVGAWTVEKAKEYTDLYHALDVRLDTLAKQLHKKKALHVDTNQSIKDTPGKKRKAA